MTFVNEIAGFSAFRSQYILITYYFYQPLAFSDSVNYN